MRFNDIKTKKFFLGLLRYVKEIVEVFKSKDGCYYSSWDRN